MRFSTAFVALLSASVAPARALGLWGSDQTAVVADDPLKIPGESPLKLCRKGQEDDIVSIDSVDLLPNPPKAYAPHLTTHKSPTEALETKRADDS